MSERSDDSTDGSDFSRRTFMKASGVAAGAAALGAGAAGSAAAEGLDPEDFEEFTNYRRRRAAHAWERGYRGRADRTLAITDSGGESRHPSLGPWNGVVATTDVEQYYEDTDDVIDTDQNGFDVVTEAGAGLRDNTGDGLDADGNVVLPDAGDTPEYVGWLNDSDRYGRHDAPRDTNSHGTHCTGIMTASGEATAVDVDRSTIDEPRAVLLPGETISYAVPAAAETAVFGSVYGEGAEVAIEAPDGRILDSSASAVGPQFSKLNNFVEHETVHGDGEATYTVHVRAPDGEAVPARVRRVAAGAFRHHADTAGDTAGSDDVAFHPGTAPGFSVFAATDLSTGTEHLEEVVRTFNGQFNIRAVNMSWGLVGGYPGGTLGGVDPVFSYDETVAQIRRMAENGVLTVAAAGNDGQPATGNGPPAAITEAVSVVATGPLDGIASYSSGGVGAVDDETGAPYTKPDITAPGGILEDLDWATMPGTDIGEDGYDDPDDEGENLGDVFEYSGKGGTSMAAPSVCGIAGLVSQAMEEDGPAEIRLPEPADTDRVDVLRLKQAVLATASTTAFNAAPFHRGKAPTYTHDDRDPYEGWGRVNAGAAVDAVSRDLESEGFESPAALGLDVPDSEQALAGYVRANDGTGDAETRREGTVEVDVEFSHYSGGNAGLARDDPHVDVFLVDAVEPVGVSGEATDGAAVGDPNIVESAQGTDGSATVGAEMAPGDVYYVVVELVNVPGAVNGNDIQANLEVDVETDFEEFVEDLIETADRTVDSSVYTGGQICRNDLSVETTRDVIVRDFVPEGFEVLEFGDVERMTPAPGGTYVYFALDGDTDLEATHFSEAPEGVDQSGTYEFGPIEVTEDTSDPDSGPTLTDREYETAGGTSRTVTVVAQDV